MFKFIRIVDKNSISGKYDLITYYTTNKEFFIQRYKDENYYTLWYNPNIIEKKKFNVFRCKLLGRFKTLKGAKEFAYKWYVDNL